jgi:protocatechuate 3,4-dioxygenase beta subunit
MRVTLGCLLLATSFGTSLQSRVNASSNVVTGRVFQDFSSNGVFDTASVVGQAVDIGVAGVEVAGYDSTGARVGATTTTGDGTYSLSVSGNVGTSLRVEFSIPSTGSLAAFRSSFAGTNSGTSIQFVSVGATDVDYAINVPGEFCGNNPNLSVSRLCAGASTDIGTSSSSWITRYDLGPYDTRHTWTSLHDTSFHNWDTTTSATQSQTGSILGMAWDPATRRVFHSAYIRRQALMYEVNGTPRPGAIFVTAPTGTVATPGVGGTTSFLVDLETLMDGDQFSNSNPAGPGYIPTNAARKIQFMQNSNVDGGVDNDGVDSDMVTGQTGVFEEVGRAGIGDIAHDGAGSLYVVSMYDKNLYKVTVPSGGVPTAMTSLGDITSGVNCVNGNGRPFSVKYWRGALYLGVVCDAETDFNPSTPAALTNANLSFTIRKHVIASSVWSTYFGPHPLNASGRVQKGLPATGQRYNRPTYTNWNAWTTTFANTETSLSPATPCTGTCYDLLTHDYDTRPQPMLSEIEFDRDGSMILAFRDRNGDIMGTGESEAPDGSSTSNMAMASGDIYRVCRTGVGFESADYVFEGATGCQPSPTPSYLSDSRHVTNQGVEFYWGDFWHRVDLYTDGTPYGGHGETSSGLTSLVPGFTDMHLSAFDPNGTSSMPTTNDLAATFFAGGVRSLSTTTGGPSGSPNIGSGVTFYGSGNTKNPPNIRSTGGFWKVNGMSDIEALCDQAPVQIGNRVWIDTNRDGIQSVDETPVAGVTVRVYSSDGATLLGTAVTSTKGEYYFASNKSEAAAGDGDHIGGGIAAGNSYVIRLDNPADYQDGGPLSGYTLTTRNGTHSATSLDAAVDSDAGTVASFPQITTVPIRAGENDHTYDVGFNRVSNAIVGVGNYVWVDADRDGIQDRGEAPLRGVTVTLFNPDGTPATTRAGIAATAVTDADGLYFIDNLRPGSYYAKFALPNGYRFTSQSSTGSQSANDSNPDATSGVTPVFTIEDSVSGDTASDTSSATLATFVNPTIDAGVVSDTVSVGNMVWRDRNGDGIQGRIDRGVAGAVLRIFDALGKPARHVNGRLVRPQTTKKDGQYLFTNLPPGRYTVRIAYPKGFVPTTKDKPDRVRNSSSHRSNSVNLAGGTSDLTLDFGVVRRRAYLLPGTR